MAFAGASFGASASIRSKGTAAIVPPPALHLARHGSPVLWSRLAYSTSRAPQARSSRCNDVAGYASNATRRLSDPCSQLDGVDAALPDQGLRMLWDADL